MDRHPTAVGVDGSEEPTGTKSSRTAKASTRGTSSVWVSIAAPVRARQGSAIAVENLKYGSDMELNATGYRVSSRSCWHSMFLVGFSGVLKKTRTKREPEKTRIVMILK